MRLAYIFISIVYFALIFGSCDEAGDLFDSSTNNTVDPLINEQVIESQNYDLRTPVYGMQVAIDTGVDTGDQSVLEILDNRAIGFLDCQFTEGAELGFESVAVEEGTTVAELSELRVYVVPQKFECEAVGISECSGIYFFSNDVIVISEGGFLGCTEFVAWKHELGHRYGMVADHSNQLDFEPCIIVPDCDLGDLID